MAQHIKPHGSLTAVSALKTLLYDIIDDKHFRFFIPFFYENIYVLEVTLPH